MTLIQRMSKNIEDLIIIKTKKMKNEYPFYPTLPVGGSEEAIKLINDFVKKMSEEADKVFTDMYCYELPHIESDSWSNFRNDIMDGFKDYKNNKIHAEYDFKAIRTQILKENYDEIVRDLNQDMVEEIEDLKQTIRSIQELRRKGY